MVSQFLATLAVVGRSGYLDVPRSVVYLLRLHHALNKTVVYSNDRFIRLPSQDSDDLLKQQDPAYNNVSDMIDSDDDDSRVLICLLNLFIRSVACYSLSGTAFMVCH